MLQYSATMSLDGFIAGPGGDMSWLTEHLAPDPAGDDPHAGVEGKEGEPFGGGWSGPQFMLTHHPPAAAVPGITFVGDLPGAVAVARTAAGARYVNVLGADVARQCLDAPSATGLRYRVVREARTA